jgi:NADPH:quinone reductase
MQLPDFNQQIVLASIPNGCPTESDFQLRREAFPVCPPNGVLLKTLWISVDPYLRGRISGKRTYIDPIPLGGLMESGCVGEVLASLSAAIPVGAIVSGFWGWQDYAAVDASKISIFDESDAPASTAIGILGMPGMTAYFGLTEICRPKPGETVLVSGAAGAVGSIVGQIAKILGCKVYGTAGSVEKLDYLTSLGFDGVLNYKDSQPYGEHLSALIPQGIDCFFDNTGGELSDAVYPLMNTRGRIAICGQISQYNSKEADIGPRPFTQILVKQLSLEGFIVRRWAERFPEAYVRMADWLKSGRLQFRETIYEGLESAPRAFIGLFHGDNTGKAIVKV